MSDQALENIQDLEDIKTTKREIFDAWRENSSTRFLQCVLEDQIREAEKKGLNTRHVLTDLWCSFLFDYLPWYGEPETIPHEEGDIKGARRHIEGDLWIVQFKLKDRSKYCYDVIIVKD